MISLYSIVNEQAGYEVVVGPRVTALRILAQTACDAADAYSKVVSQPQSAVSDDDYCRADELAYDTRQALLTILERDYGIDHALAVRLGGIL